MGVPFVVGITPKEALLPIFARTKSKFWSLKHLFRAKTPLKGRLTLLQKVLGGTAFWCTGAFVPDKFALHCINMLQSQLVMWSMRLAKGPGEAWVEYRVRCLRSARYAIQTHMRVRWSTLWLQRCWDYSGHRARGVHREVIPGCSLLDLFRRLEGEEQQGLSEGIRHPARFYPSLMTEERAMNLAAGGNWRDKANDRTAWAHLRQTWIHQEDLPWASLEQLSLEV